MGARSILSTLRGLAVRGGTNAMILVVAVIAVAASCAGPIYYRSSQVSILRANLTSQVVLGRGYEVTQFGPVGLTVSQVEGELSGATGRYAALFGPPTSAIEAEVIPARTGTGTTLVWRSSVCAHLSISGTCPEGPDQVIVSRSYAEATDLRVGSALEVSPYGTLTVTGIYSAPTVATDYWFGLAGIGTYFPFENPTGGAGQHGVEDSLFTPESTFTAEAASTAQGRVDVDVLLAPDRIRPDDVAGLAYTMANINADPRFEQFQAVATTDIPQTLATVRAAWSSLAVPVLLVTLQLLGLAWLLLFLLVSEAVSARGPEIALAKLRGFGGWRTALFGLSEQASILMVSLPVGAAAGWGAASLLARALLQSGTPVSLSGVAWAAAAAATIGGLISVVAASVRTLRRGVAEQWRRTASGGGGRTWVFDSVLLTAAAAGLAELFASGRVSSAHRSALSLLVPGLLGVAVAVVASRTLPLLCRLFARLGRPSGLAPYLALRWVARRPGGPRTTIMLTTSFALATFAMAGWALDQTNYTRVADATVGAPTVIDVSAPAGSDLAAIAASSARRGRAAVVDEYSSNGTTTLAVDPSTWARVASLSPAARAGLARLQPPEPAPLVIQGNAVRIDLTVNALRPANTVLTMDVLETGAQAPTPLDFSTVPVSGTVTETATTVGCPCTIEDITLVPPPSERGVPLTGSVELHSLQDRTTSGWVSVGGPDPFEPGKWQSADTESVPDQIGPGADGGISWAFQFANDADATLDYADRPSPLPALAASAVTGGRTGSFAANGLNGGDLAVYIDAIAPSIPGAPATGVVVDRTFAELDAEGNLALTAEQVWLGAGVAVGPVQAALRQRGVEVIDVKTESAYAKGLDEQGPGLARVLFLGEAGVVAVLAAAGTILGLYLTARRRRYELAALMASGVTTRTLLAAVVGEQVVLVLFGVVVGVATGVAAVIVALRDVPEFLTVPTAPTLASFPSSATLALAVVVAVVVVVAAAVCAGASIAGRVRLEQLRETLQ